MYRRILIVAIIAVISVSCLNGCKESSDDAQQEVKTAAEYRVEAKEQINKENMAQELDRIDKELEQDIGQEE